MYAWRANSANENRIMRKRISKCSAEEQDRERDSERNKQRQTVFVVRRERFPLVKHSAIQRKIKCDLVKAFGYV